MQIHRYDVLRKIIKFLEDQPEVLYYRLENACEIHIMFSDKFVEHWVYNEDWPSNTNYRSYLIPDDGHYPFDDRFPDITPAYTVNPLDKHADLLSQQFNITPSHLSKYAFCNVRIFLHRLAHQLEQEGYCGVWNPESVIDNIGNRLDLIPMEYVKFGREFMEHASHSSLVRPLLFQVSHIRDTDLFWIRRFLFPAIDRIHRKGKPINRTSILHRLRHKSLFKIDTGLPVALFMLIKDVFGHHHLVNHTNIPWINIVSMVTRHYEDTVHISDVLIDDRPLILFDSAGDYTIGQQSLLKDNIRVSIYR